MFFQNIYELLIGGIGLDKSIRIITNNSLVKDKYEKDSNIELVDGKYIDVLKSARNMVHKGAKLITHPLMGSIKPNETPYRSIVVLEGTSLDIESLAIIESSIATAEKFQIDNKVPLWNENILEDFRFVDLKLLESALDSITK
ncbi:MAG: GrdX family protein [Clostridiaceae bacterium]|nr:GrdX family protein [Clostridiaceae bacterium]